MFLDWFYLEDYQDTLKNDLLSFRLGDDKNHYDAWDLVQGNYVEVPNTRFRAMGASNPILQ